MLHMKNCELFYDFKEYQVLDTSFPRIPILLDSAEYIYMYKNNKYGDY